MNWNGHRPERHTPGAHLALLRDRRPHPADMAPSTRYAPPPVVAGQQSRPVPSWLPACDE